MYTVPLIVTGHDFVTTLDTAFTTAPIVLEALPIVNPSSTDSAPSPNAIEFCILAIAFLPIAIQLFIFDPPAAASVPIAIVSVLVA